MLRPRAPPCGRKLEDMRTSRIVQDSVLSGPSSVTFYAPFSARLARLPDPLQLDTAPQHHKARILFIFLFFFFFQCSCRSGLPSCV